MSMFVKLLHSRSIGLYYDVRKFFTQNIGHDRVMYERTCRIATVTQDKICGRSAGRECMYLNEYPKIV